MALTLIGTIAAITDAVAASLVSGSTATRDAVDARVVAQASGAGPTRNAIDARARVVVSDVLSGPVSQIPGVEAAAVAAVQQALAAGNVSDWKGTLATSVDLDTRSTPGRYGFWNQNPNSPGFSGTLTVSEVRSTGGSVTTMQIAYEAGGEFRIFARFNGSSGTWSAWARVDGRAMQPAVVEAGFSADGHTPTAPPAIFNTATGYAGLPVQIGGLLETFYVTAGGVLQRYTVYGTDARFYTRYSGTAGWSAWSRLDARDRLRVDLLSITEPTSVDTLIDTAAHQISSNTFDLLTGKPADAARAVTELWVTRNATANVIRQEWRQYVDGGTWLVWERSRRGVTWSAWARTDIKALDAPSGNVSEAVSVAGFKTVPLSLTLGVSGSTTATPGAVRWPVRFGARINRYRVHVVNVNPRFGSVGPSRDITGVWLGTASGTAGRMTGVTQIGTAGSTGSSEYVTEWNTAGLNADTDYLVSVGHQGSSDVQLNLGGGYTSATVAEASSTAGTWTRQTSTPFSVWIEAEVAPDVPVIAVYGDSISAGAGATFPVYDSWLSQYCRKNGALPVHYAASGIMNTTVESRAHYFWQRWVGLSKPDAVINMMGNNDVFSGITLEAMKTRRATSQALLAELVSPVIMSATITPRDSDTANEPVRRAYNTWLKTREDSRDVFDFSAAISTDDETITPAYNADGTHFNTAGYTQLANAITRPLVPITTDNYDSGLLNITPALANIASGTVRMQVRNGWGWISFENVQPTVGGAVEFTATGLLNAAPAAPIATADSVLTAADGTSRRVSFSRNGQLRAFGLFTTDVLNGTLMWPLMRSVPVTIPGI